MAYPKHHLYEPEQQEFAGFGFVISHPARMGIIRDLGRYGVLTRSDILKNSPLSTTAISDHLRYLERAQLIRIGKSINGNKTGYVLEKERYLQYLRQLRNWLDEVPVKLVA